MKYMKEERLDIERRIFEREITLQQALDEYGITERTATRYKDLYKAEYGLTGNYRPRSLDAAQRAQVQPFHLWPNRQLNFMIRPPCS